MTRVRATSFVAAVLAIACGGVSEPTDGEQSAWRETGDAALRVEYHDADAPSAPAMLEHARAGRAAASQFFGESFASAFVVRVYPDRPTLTAYWRSAWGQPSLVPECWMIASATRAVAVILSPRTWPSSACGHNGSDATHVRRIVTHEIVHVLHGQLNALPEINAVGALKWLNEGVAYYVAGQLSDAGRSQVRTLVASGYAPTSLESILAGQGGYAAAASVVGYIDQTFGRDALTRLLRATTTADALTMLGTSEPALLHAWRESQR